MSKFKTEWEYINERMAMQRIKRAAEKVYLDSDSASFLLDVDEGVMASIFKEQLPDGLTLEDLDKMAEQLEGAWVHKCRSSEVSQWNQN